jgi:pimeloyl-ACP methyl ester carboxylesterase
MVWRAFSNGVFSSEQGPAYEPWKNWKRESEEGAGPLSLVASAILHELDRISLDTHIKDITNTLFYEDLSNVILVGHSYGGMVITGVAAKQPQRLAHLVYFDAYLPMEGENEIALWPPNQKEKYFADIASGATSMKLGKRSLLTYQELLY